MGITNRRPAIIYLCFVLLCFFPENIFGQGNEIMAVHIDSPPKIDGFLDDPAWSQAAVIEDFIQREPDPGQAASEKTQVYICFGDKEVYIGFRCYDDPGKITAKELKRDISLGEDDRVQMIIDTYLDQRNGFWFQVGPRGSIGDALVSENGAVLNKQWDGLWEGKARIRDFGWDAEMAIPFKTLRFRPGVESWGIKFIRNIRRRLEASYWPVANLNSFRFQVSDAGVITGLKNMSQGTGLEIKPYGLTGLNGKYGEKTKFVYNLGGDVFYQLTTGLNAALTINTDFAQTEVDSRQVNLTRFALFFPEKRNFFLDGANYFNFGFNGDDENHNSRSLIPYFSRRIGLDNNGNPIPIVAGVKLAGQVGNWNIGALNITDKTDTSFRNFTVARVTRNIGKQSYIGMLGTRGNAGSIENNWLAGLDVKIASSKVGGNKNLIFTAYGLKSNTELLSEKDYSFGADINYPNDFINARLGHQEIGENFRAGLGFIPRVGIRDTYGEFFVGPRPNRFGILKINSGAMMNYITDMSSKLLTRDIFFKMIEFEFRSGEKAEFALSNNFEFLDEDFMIFPKDSIAVSAGTYDFWGRGVEFSTAPRRNIWLAVNFNWGEFFSGSNTKLEIKNGIKLGVPFFVGMQYEQNNAHIPEGEFITRVYRLNADIYFNPDITLSNFIQYDNISDSWGWQSRFRWIMKPGNELIFVWNSRITMMEASDRYIMAENTTRLKLNYTIRF